LILVRKAWTEDNFTFHGRYHTVAMPVSVVPKTVQKPHPPVYVACFTEPTMRRAAENRFNFIFGPLNEAMMFGSLAQCGIETQGALRRGGTPEFEGGVFVFHVYRGHAGGKTRSAGTVALLPGEFSACRAAGSRENTAAHSLLSRYCGSNQAHAAAGPW